MLSESVLGPFGLFYL